MTPFLREKLAPGDGEGKTYLPGLDPRERIPRPLGMGGALELSTHPCFLSREPQTQKGQRASPRSHRELGVSRESTQCSHQPA